jgi:hypothetical protein
MLNSGKTGKISSMKHFLIAVGLLGCVGCSGIHGPEEGFDGVVGATTSIYVGHGQSCTARSDIFGYAVKYPSRLPQGVSVKSISANDDFLLTASNDAVIGQSKAFASGISITVVAPTTTPPAICESDSFNI